MMGMFDFCRWVAITCTGLKAERSIKNLISAMMQLHVRCGYPRPNGGKSTPFVAQVTRIRAVMGVQMDAGDLCLALPASLLMDAVGCLNQALEVGDHDLASACGTVLLLSIFGFRPSTVGSIKPAHLAWGGDRLTLMVGFLKGMPGSRAPFVFTLPSSTPEGMVEELDPFLAIARWASGCQEREEDLFRGQLPGARHGDEAWSKVFSDAVRLVVDHLGWKVPPNTKVSGKSGRKAFASIAAEVSCFETKICDWGQWSVTHDGGLGTGLQADV